MAEAATAALPGIKHTRDQRLALELLSTDARYIELRGGARSGKTVTFIEALLARANAANRSRHLVARFRGNSLGSIFGPTGTFWWVLERTYGPDYIKRIKHNSEKGYYLLPGCRSEVWYGGLDDPKRVDKLLGNEYATILVNEGSQVPYGSFTTVITRLAQVVARNDGQGNLRQRLYVDDNPPPESHWLPVLFQQKRDPISKRPLKDPMAYATMVMNPEGNKENLDPAFLASLDQLPERQRKRFYEGKNGDAGEAALWTSELLDQQRMLDSTNLPDFVRVVVSIDPSGADSIEDTEADEIGIGVAALGTDGICYILEDLTMKGGPSEWAKVAADAYDRHDADCVVAEVNYGGAMVGATMQTAKPGIPFHAVTATRGKHIRAEPVAGLFEVGKVKLVGRFPELEDELVSMTTAGYTGTKSPNRLDWMVWAVTYLFPKIIKHAKQEERDSQIGIGHGVTVNTGSRVRLGQRARGRR